jgi:hemolysin D
VIKLKQLILAANEEIKSAEKTVLITKEQEALKRKIEGARKHLYDRKTGSLLSYLQSRDATLAAKRAHFDARNLRAGKIAALAAKKTDLSILLADREEFTASWSSGLGESRSKDEEIRIQLSQEAVKLRRDMMNTEVRAPAEGIVLDLPKVTSGSIVREGDVLLTLVRVNQQPLLKWIFHQKI